MDEEKECTHKFIYVEKSFERIKGTSEFEDNFGEYHTVLCEKCGEVRKTQPVYLEK